ncbi:MAG: hypothetical protein EBS59_07590 [Verrucomicrobia bacterium]|nr:hypothetical protein [Verrucomicrobiota bacterium]
MIIIFLLFHILLFFHKNINSIYSLFLNLFFYILPYYILFIFYYINYILLLILLYIMDVFLMYLLLNHQINNFLILLYKFLLLFYYQ